ncbi:MAG TPA: phosphodiester glycosidase family protein, partial [Myxococcota bacterium]
SSCKANPPLARSLAFTSVAPGIEHAVFDAAGSPAFSGHAFIIDLKKVDVRLVPAGAPGDKRTVDVIAAAAPAHLASNASFFDETGKAMGRAVDGGKAIGSEKRSAWGALVIDQGVARIVLGDTLTPDKPGGDLVVQGLPRLVVDGDVPHLKPAVAERTAVCASGSTITLVVTGKADATDLAKFLALPKDKGGLGCTDALNFDGGPSTQLDVALPGMKLTLPGGWGVPNALVAIPRP